MSYNYHKAIQQLDAKLLTNKFFSMLDKVARYEGEDILMVHDRFCIKNLGVTGNLKFVELSNINHCAPFKSVIIGVPVKPKLKQWWIDGKKYKHYFREGKFSDGSSNFFETNNYISNNTMQARLRLSNGKIDSTDFITFTSKGWWLDCAQWYDRYGIYGYLLNCLEVFSIAKNLIEDNE